MNKKNLAVIFSDFNFRTYKKFSFLWKLKNLQFYERQKKFKSLIFRVNFAFTKIFSQFAETLELNFRNLFAFKAPDVFSFSFSFFFRTLIFEYGKIFHPIFRYTKLLLLDQENLEPISKTSRLGKICIPYRFLKREISRRL